MSIFIRIVIAIIGFVFFNLLLEPVCRLLTIPLSGDMLRVIQLCGAAIAVFFIILGPNNWPWRKNP